MARKNYAVEEIIKHLRTIEIENGRGVAIEDACTRNFTTGSYATCNLKSLHVCGTNDGGRPAFTDRAWALKASKSEGALDFGTRR